MKIYELVKDINKKVTIKTSRVLEVKKHYLSLYRANMVYMYDRGYISDPTVFDSREILGNIVDLNIKHLSGVTGRIELNEEYIIPGAFDERVCKAVAKAVAEESQK